jgi:hypothetical protein
MTSKASCSQSHRRILPFPLSRTGLQKFPGSSHRRAMVMLTLSYLKIAAPFKDYPGIVDFPGFSEDPSVFNLGPHGAHGFFFLTWRQKKLQ